jgi:hypothetical protein
MGARRAWLANRLWLASAAGQGWRFRRSLAHPAAAQTARLRRIVAANAMCEAGRRGRFDRITSVADYRQRVPLCDYDDLATEIERMAAGEVAVLTAERVRLFEPSSGSTASSKLIPYTARLQAEFQAGLAAWIGNLYGAYPDLARGPAYWSISPLSAGPRRTSGGTPIGFEEDSAYLGQLGRLVEAAMAVPNGLKQITDVAAFRYVTLLWLLGAADLRLVSVWNPTFWTLLLADLSPRWERLLADLAAGTLHPPGELAGAVQSALARRLRPAPLRAQALAQIDPREPAAAQTIWPQLGLISCWADAAAAPYAAVLARALPQVTIQPKGLLATEAMVSLPWVGAPAPVAAITSHFLEFELEDGALKLVDELMPGDVASVVVTTGGGLYRYRLHDRVEMVGRLAATPCLRFVGKGDRVADWFGEKLHEGFVAAVLAELCQSQGLVADFMLLAPDQTGTGPAYTLFVETASRLAPQLEAALDAALQRNFHYAYCRRLGQLAPAQVMAVRGGAATYLAVCQDRGMRLGNIKPAVLDGQAGWRAAFMAGGADAA